MKQKQIKNRTHCEKFPDLKDDGSIPESTVRCHLLF